MDSLPPDLDKAIQGAAEELKNMPYPFARCPKGLAKLIQTMTKNRGIILSDQRCLELAQVYLNDYDQL